MKGENYVAIGDIHGEADKLLLALARISQWATHGLSGDDRLTYVFLGDYIDRGPEPRKVLEIVQDYVETRGAIALLGNHDMMMMGTADGTLTKIGSNERPWADLWQWNDGIETCRQLHGYISNQYTQTVSDVRGYTIKIKESKEYKFLKEHGKEYFETELLHFSHAPQSNLNDLNLYWGHPPSDYTHSNWDQIFKVPSMDGNPKKMSIHGHLHRLKQDINYPRIVNKFKNDNHQTIVLADCGCGCGDRGELHPVIVREDLKVHNGVANFAEIVAIL